MAVMDGGMKEGGRSLFVCDPNGAGGWFTVAMGPHKDL